jgi:hypothetical protein
LKKTVIVSISIFLFVIYNTKAYAQDEEKPVFVFSEGIAASWLTRIIDQTDRSNFVFKDFLPGVYFRTDLINIKHFTPMARITAYYPLISTFNKVPQVSKTPLHIGADLVAGVKFDILEFKYFRLNAGPALHLFFLTADRWNYLDLGGALFLGMEVPLAKRWTVVFNGFASLDYGNFGGNSFMEPFNTVFQYQIDIGVRFSKKLENKTFLILEKSSQIRDEIVSDENEVVEDEIVEDEVVSDELDLSVLQR